MSNEVPYENTALDLLNRAQGFKSFLYNGAKAKDSLKYGILAKLFMEQYAMLMRFMRSENPVAITTRQTWGIKNEKHLETEATAFSEEIQKALKLAEDGVTDQSENYLFYKLRRAFVDEDVAGLAAEMKYAFMNLVLRKQYSAQVDANQKALTDLRYPMEWFPGTRTLQRRIHLHVGPTNSGKTYHALRRLEQAATGIYAGPLRLLAHEVYTRLNAKGINCALVTGEERRIPEGVDSFMKSCTVEMVPLNNLVDVAVIDEIQMMGDVERGWAWTQAFLGVMAKEVHLCGELRTVSLIRDLCAAIGDELIIHEYERLSPLELSRASLRGDVKNLRKGDAVILFSRVQIHAMKNHIEEATGRRCAVVYGSLPPETRAQQANLFNDPNNDYDFLVASDAVGMGLNLSIQRIIFESTWKFDGSSYQQLPVPELKQIAGRAGRYRTARDAIQKQPIDITDGAPADIEQPIQLQAAEDSNSKGNVGYVTAFDKQDLDVVRKALVTEPRPLRTANVLPPTSILTRFASYFPPTTPFSYILLRLHDISTIGSCFKLCRIKEQIEVADLIQSSNLSIKDRIIFTAAPVSLRDPGFPEVVMEFAECVAQQSNGHILEIKSMPFELLDIKQEEYEADKEAYLRAIESLHKAITLYLWLSYRYSGVFQSQALAFHLKEQVEEKISDCLANVDYDARRRQKIRQITLRQRLMQRLVDKKKAEQDPDMAKERLELELELVGEDDVDIPSTHMEPIFASDDTTALPSDDEESVSATEPPKSSAEDTVNALETAAGDAREHTEPAASSNNTASGTNRVQL